MGGFFVVSSKEEWDEFVNKNTSGRIVVVDFSAAWCGPCRIISPYFEQLSDEFPGTYFLKVDVDEVEAVASEAGVTAMPTFQVYQDGEKVDELVGASKDRLQRLVHQASRLEGRTP